MEVGDKIRVSNIKHERGMKDFKRYYRNRIGFIADISGVKLKVEFVGNLMSNWFYEEELTKI